MGIYDPRTFLSRDDIELLRLLSTLLLEYDRSSSFSNFSADGIPLSVNEAHNLLDLLERFVVSKKFVEGSYFIENLFSGGDVYDPRLRGIYLNWRRRQGRSSAMSMVHWRRFINRLGIVKESSGYLTGGYVIDAEKMELSYFRKMEERLLTATGIHPRVREIILQFVDARLASIEKLRVREAVLPKGSVVDPLKRVQASLKPNADLKKLRSDSLSVEQISSVMLLVADFSVLFTTRDWDVCGTMSAMAAAAPTALNFKNSG